MTGSTPPAGIPAPYEWVAVTAADLRPPPSTRALLFDLDGTLVNSAQANLDAYNSALREVGVQIPSGWFARRFGLPAPVILEEVNAEWGLDLDINTYVDRKNQTYLALTTSIEVFPVMADLLSEEHQTRAIAVVTSSPTVTAEAVLEATGLANFVSVLVTRDDVEATKPAPDAYLLAAERLGVAPENCLAYEDTDEGISAARASGAAVIDVRAILQRNGGDPDDHR